MYRGTVFSKGSKFSDNVIKHKTFRGDYGGVFRSFGGTVICHSCSFLSNGASDIDGHSTDDIFADISSYVEIKDCSPSSPSGYVQNSYLKCNSVTKDKFNCVESCVYENAFEENYNFSDFISFNVSDDKSYNAVLDYLSNHSVSSLFINFTGDYDFVVQPPFDRSMSVIFKNNGFDVRFKDRDGGDKLEITRSISLHFIDFTFDNVMIANRGTSSFLNCSFYNNERDFFSNEGSTSLINCSIFNNHCGDYLIYNAGVLTIYDSSFSNNSIDDSDYGFIYNKGGSVTSMNTTFNDGYVHIYNFASGDCAVGGDNASATNVIFDEPWANWKVGAVRGAFLLGTAIVSYGAGAYIGSVLPSFAGLVVSSIVGAGVGFASGICYGVFEGEIYHDYSNLWKNAAAFTILGLSVAQTGWMSGSDFVKKIGNNPNSHGGQAGSGGPGGQDGPGGQGGDGGMPHGPQQEVSTVKPGLDKLGDDPNFINALNEYIGNEVHLLRNLQNNYPELTRFLSRLYASLGNNPQGNVYDMLNFLSSVQTVLAGDIMANNNLNNQVNILDRIGNNLNNNINENHVENILPMAQGTNLVNNFISSTAILQNNIHGNPNLSYLENMLSLNTYSYAENNRAHVERVLTLLNDFRVLQERASRLGYMYLSDSMVSTLNLYNGNIGRRGHSRTINALFDFNHPNRIQVWENIYQNALAEFNHVLKSAKLNNSLIDDLKHGTDGGNLSVSLKNDLGNLIAELESKFIDDEFKGRFVSLKELYTENFVKNDMEDLDLLLIIYHQLVEIDMQSVGIDCDAYNQCVSFDYVKSIKENIYNGIFNHYEIFSQLKVIEMVQDFYVQLKLFKSINYEAYCNATNSQHIFGVKIGSSLKYILDGFSHIYNTSWKIERAATFRDSFNKKSEVEKADILKKTYYNISVWLDKSGLRQPINQTHVNFYHIKHLFPDYALVYANLSDCDRLMVNKYFYDQCCELIKTFANIDYDNGFIVDYSKNLTALSNIKKCLC